MCHNERAEIQSLSSTNSYILGCLGFSDDFSVVAEGQVSALVTDLFVTE